MLNKKQIEDIRNDFPMFKNSDSVYFDSAATTFKPQSVIDRVTRYYTHESYNVGRSDYIAAFNVEKEVNQVRALVADFINAEEHEIIFTAGATASLNLIAFSYGRKHLTQGDVILTTRAEHASNILPWFKVAEATGASIEYIELDETGQLTVDKFEETMHDKVKVVTLAAVTNVLGVIAPMQEICEIAHRYDAIVVCDGAQSVPHTLTDVKAMGVDFLAFSGHKILGPTGVGVLFGKYDILQSLEPYYQGGGSNARYNPKGEISYKNAPARFESGTLAIEAILGLGAALEYVNKIGLKNIIEYELELSKYLVSEMLKLDHVTVYNPDTESGIVSFNVKGIFSQDVSTYLDTQGIQVRSGHHCSKIINGVIDAYDTVRASVYFYNTFEEVDRFIEALKTTTIENCINLFI